MVAKLSRWEAIADSLQILDLDLLGWVGIGSPKAFASVKHRQQHVTFIPDPLGSPKDHSKTSSKQNARSAWLVFHARILSCSEGLGGPLNSKPHNISKVHWWMLSKGISGQHATTHEKPKSIQKSGVGNASGSEIMVAKLSRWEAIADSPQILDLDLLGWFWTGSPKAFASVKHLKQHVTFIPDPLDSPKDHSKTSSKQNAKSAWLVFHARILSCSEGLGGPLNSKPHNISEVHWWMLSKGISGQHATTQEKPKSIQKSGGWKCIRVWNHGCQAFPVRGYRWQSPNLRLRPFGMGRNWFPKSICVSEASPTACDFHSRPTGFPKRPFQNQFQTECTVCLAGLPCSHPFLFRRTRRTPKL